MKTLILHIGVENTATTFLQQTFANSRDALRQAGVLYPRAPGHSNHIALAVLSMEPARAAAMKDLASIEMPEDAVGARQRLLEELTREIAESDCDTLLLSNEHCSSRLINDEDVLRLKDLLSPLAETIRIVVYLRRQDEALLSMYSTMVRSGRSQALQPLPEHVIAHRFDYARLLERWARTFGRENIVARLFNQMRNGSILDDFAEAAGLPAEISWRELQDRLNTRLDARQTEFLRILNGHFPEFEKEGQLLRRGDLSYAVSQLTQSGPPLTLEAGMTTEILQQLHASNLSVARDYFGRECAGDPLFGEAEIPEGTGGYQMTLETFAEMTAELWALKHRQNQYLMQRLRAKKTDGDS